MQRARNLQWMFHTTTLIGILLDTWWAVAIQGAPRVTVTVSSLPGF